MHRLPHTWDALLSRFGRFTEIQAQAIDPLLHGQNCILISATASGKTEAALAPLLERQFRKVQQTAKSAVQSTMSEAKGRSLGLQTLFIVPTRALTRDLYRRLEQPMHKLSVHMRIKTSDELPIRSSRPPQLLLTTPESFDSMLANRPRMLKDVRAVVLDEIHLYDNTARGDQVRILLNRLRRIKSFAFERGETTSAEVQFCALSATVNDPASVAARYFIDPCVVQAKGQRSLEAEILEFVTADSLQALFADLQRRGCRKVLAFCERRAECEQLAHRFQHNTPFGSRIFVHHATLDARLRRHVEQAFSSAEAALCFATSTLELGIDIGDVDLVILIGPPESVGSLLQRTGRGNRRTSQTRLVCFYRTQTEQAVFNVLLRHAMAGIIEPSDYFFRSSIVVQQLCSYIKQTRFGELEPAHAFGLFHSPDGTAPLISIGDYTRIVNHLIAQNYFGPARGSALRPARKWQELYERRGIYTNLNDAQRNTLDVIDETTGRRLGEVMRSEMSAKKNRAFIFAGHVRRTSTAQGRKLIVRTSDDTSATELPSRTPHRPMRPWLAERLAIELGLPRPNHTTGITLLVAHTDNEKQVYESTGENDSLSPEKDERAWLLHCAGEAYGIVLGDLLEDLYKVEVTACTELHLALNRALPSTAIMEFTSQQVGASVIKRWREFESWYDLGSFQAELPPEIRRANVIDAFNIPEFFRRLSNHKVILDS